MPLRAVVFDVGGVLVESPFTAAIRWGQRWDLPMEAFATLYAEYSKVPEPGEEPPMWHEVECGRLPLSAFIDVIRTSFEAPLPPDHPARSLRAEGFNPFADAKGHPAMFDLAREIKDAGITTGILTNNVHEWRAWRDVVPVGLFDHVVDSCEVGLRKPDPAIYALVQERCGVSGDELLFLDDHQGNVEAALDLGWQAQLVDEDIDGAVATARRSVGLEPRRGPG